MTRMSQVQGHMTNLAANSSAVKWLCLWKDSTTDSTIQAEWRVSARVFYSDV
jgi:hypothetical protein